MPAIAWARAYAVATIAIGTALLSVAVWHASAYPLTTLALLAAAGFFTELFLIPRDGSSFDPRDSVSFTFSTSVHIAAVLLLGPWAGALTAAFGVLAADTIRRRAVQKNFFCLPRDGPYRPVSVNA